MCIGYFHDQITLPSTNIHARTDATYFSRSFIRSISHVNRCSVSFQMEKVIIESSVLKSLFKCPLCNEFIHLPTIVNECFHRCKFRSIYLNSAMKIAVDYSLSAVYNELFRKRQSKQVSNVSDDNCEPIKVAQA